MVQVDGDLLKFSSGKQVYAHGGNPNIALGKPEVLIYDYGYDGCLFIAHPENHIAGEDGISLDDAIELADAMIKTWTEHKQYLIRKHEGRRS